jgi:hypothetical protein
MSLTNIQKLAKSLIKSVNWLKVAKVSANALLTGMTPAGPIVNVISNAIKHQSDYFI